MVVLLFYNFFLYISIRDISYLYYAIMLFVLIHFEAIRTPAFGDFRDQAILELEYRIYNNIRVDYSSTLSDHRNAEPGAFRQTGYSYDEWTQLLSNSFLEWAGSNGVNVFDNLF